MTTDILPGTVFDSIEKNYYDDSDFYAIHWDGDRIAVSLIGSTRYAGGVYKMEPDATEDVWQAAEKWFAAWTLERLIGSWDIEQEKPNRIGARILVDRGKHAGRKGTVRWFKEQRSAHGTWHYGWRIGVKFDDAPADQRGYEFLNADQVHTIDREPAPLMPFTRTALTTAQRRNFRALAYPESWI